MSRGNQIFRLFRQSLETLPEKHIVFTNGWRHKWTYHDLYRSVVNEVARQHHTQHHDVVNPCYERDGLRFIHRFLEAMAVDRTFCNILTTDNILILKSSRRPCILFYDGYGMMEEDFVGYLRKIHKKISLHHNHTVYSTVDWDTVEGLCGMVYTLTRGALLYGKPTPSKVNIQSCTHIKQTRPHVLFTNDQMMVYALEMTSGLHPNNAKNMMFGNRLHTIVLSNGHYNKLYNISRQFNVRVVDMNNMKIIPRHFEFEDV